MGKLPSLEDVTEEDLRRCCSIAHKFTREEGRTLAELFGIDSHWYNRLLGKNRSPRLTKWQIADVLQKNGVVSDITRGVTAAQLLIKQYSLGDAYWHTYRSKESLDGLVHQLISPYFHVDRGEYKR